MKSSLSHNLSPSKWLGQEKPSSIPLYGQSNELKLPICNINGKFNVTRTREEWMKGFGNSDSQYSPEAMHLNSVSPTDIKQQRRSTRRQTKENGGY